VGKVEALAVEARLCHDENGTLRCGRPLEAIGERKLSMTGIKLDPVYYQYG
jgi:hypothetical protein